MYALEASLLTPEVRASAQDLDRLIAEDFMEIGSSGTLYTKASVIEALLQESKHAPLKWVMSHFEVHAVAEGLVLATFKTETTMPDGTPRAALRASLWRQRGEAWRLVFHQGTPTK